MELKEVAMHHVSLVLLAVFGRAGLYHVDHRPCRRPIASPPNLITPLEFVFLSVPMFERLNGHHFCCPLSRCWPHTLCFVIIIRTVMS
jgi:hypothetical protein